MIRGGLSVKRIDYDYVKKNLRSIKRGDTLIIIDRKISKNKVINISPLLDSKTLIIASLTATSRGDTELSAALLDRADELLNQR